MQTAEHIAELVVGFFANEFFWLAVLFMVYRLVSRLFDKLPETASEYARWRNRQ